MSIKRLDPTNPEDLTELVATGVIWNPTVPAQYRDTAIDALADGSVSPNELVPPAVLDEVNARRADRGLGPIEVGGTPEDEGEPSA